MSWKGEGQRHAMSSRGMKSTRMQSKGYEVPGTPQTQTFELIKEQGRMDRVVARKRITATSKGNLYLQIRKWREEEGYKGDPTIHVIVPKGNWPRWRRRL